MIVVVGRCWWCLRDENVSQFAENRCTTHFLLLFLCLKLTVMSGKVDLSWNEVKVLQSQGAAILVDVREKNELQETGELPNSFNIPLGELPGALQSSASDFKSNYGFDQPAKDAPLVFSCRSGNRSRRAMNSAQELGYKNAKHYVGGWLDYEQNHK